MEAAGLRRETRCDSGSGRKAEFFSKILEYCISIFVVRWKGNLYKHSLHPYGCSPSDKSWPVFMRVGAEFYLVVQG